METIYIVLIAAGLAWAIVSLVRNHAPSTFQARVAGALHDLGIDVNKLDQAFRKKLEIECAAYYGATKKRASPRLLAVRFFVFSLTESERFPIGAVIKEAPLISSISIIRKWAADGKLPEKLATKEIDRLKIFLVEAIPSEEMAKEERLATEIQILEL